MLACRSSCLHHVLNNGYVSCHIECPAVSDIGRRLGVFWGHVFGIVNVITPESPSCCHLFEGRGLIKGKVDKHVGV